MDQRPNLRGHTFVGGSLANLVGYFLSDYLVKREISWMFPDLEFLPDRMDFTLRRTFRIILLVAWLVPIGLTIWLAALYISNLVDHEDEFAIVNRLFLALGFVTIIAIGITSVISHWITQRIVAPVAGVTNLMAGVSRGNSN